MDEEVLIKSFRGHTAKQTEDAAKMILENGFELGLQMMIGLPGDTIEKSINTAQRIIECGASNTRIYPAVVIKGTVLHTWFEKGKYLPLTIEEAVQWTTQILPLFEKAEVKILRVGLHPSEGLLSGHELVAGPFHQSFKELVLTEIWKNQLKSLIENRSEEKLTVYVSPKELNYAIGYGAANKKMLLEQFNAVEFVSKPEFKGRNFKFLLC
jgi:histone acetyltransferase (RNA polymerase elongator complex component)